MFGCWGCISVNDMNTILLDFLKRVITRIIFRNYNKGFSLTLLLIILISAGSGSSFAQVATYYNFSQSNGTYTAATSGFIDTTGLATTTPAKIFATSWDDKSVIFRLPFDFTYNGILYQAGTGRIGLDTDAWFTFSNGNPVMTGALGGGSWVSISDHSGVYLMGTANNNGFAGFNCDLNDQSFATFTGTRTSGSNSITGVSSTANLRIGTRLSGTGISDGTIVTAIAGTTVTMSANATSNSSAAITPRSSIIGFINGVAPNRQFVIQWTHAKRYAGAAVDEISFQMRINEAGGIPNLQTLQVIYGAMSSTDASNLDTQVGLRGADSLDFNARVSNTGWASTTAAVANSARVRFNNTTIPASGLTFTWSPCTVAPGAAGAISGSNPVCAQSTATYTLAAVPGATLYTWTYTGTGATFSATTSTPSNAISFAAGATGGTLTVTPSNLCGSGTASSIVLSILPAPTASISYPSATYCNNVAGMIAVTQTGTSGGSYSAVPAGLTINGAGGITPITSSPGVYTVTYSFTNGTCSNTTTTNVTIAALPVVTATSTPSLICINGNAQLQATVAGAGSTYTVNSIPYVNTTPSGSPTLLWSSYIDDGMSAAVPLPFTFNFYGQAITQFYVSTNGYIQLQASTANALTPQTLPNATNPNNIIALAWDDLVLDPSTNPGAFIRYFVNGIAPNRVMVIDYYNLRFIAGTGVDKVTGQIKLYENDNHIEIAAAIINDNGYNDEKTMGIENNTGTLGLTPPGRNNVNFNFSTPEAWSFSLDNSTYTFLWSPATFLSNTTISNPVAGNVTSTTAYNVLVTNATTGCSSNTPVTVTALPPLNGTYTVGVGGNFTTLTAAVNAYNTICIGGPVLFSLIDNSYPSETFPIIINSNAYASAVNTLTIKPAAGITPVITGSNANGIIKLSGADYVTIDGSNTVGGTTRNLTLINTSSNTTTSTIVWLASASASNGATNNSVKHCTLTGNSPSTTFTALLSSGIVAGDIAEAANSNNTYQNNLINRCQTAIALVGATGNEQGNIINGNTTGSSTAGDKLGWSGIELYQQANAQVTDNTVFGVTSNNSTTALGIAVYGGASGITISGNKVYDIKNTSTSGWGSNGIYLGSSSTTANVTVINNFVFDVASYGYTARDENDNGYGIMVDYGGGYNIYYNTVLLNTNQSVSGYPACINISNLVTTAASVNIKNNIFMSSQTNAGERYAIQSTAANTVFGTINYNSYNTAGANLGYIASTNRAALANIQAGFGQNVNSIVPATVPVFMSATDLHINAANAGNITNLKNRGNPITGITSDYDTQTRNGLTPDLGADEWVDPNYGSWVGKVSIDWLVPANWEANYVPDQTTDVFITGGYTFMPTIVTTQAIRALALSAPGTPPLLTINGGTLQVFGNITRTGGTINGANGTMEMKGSAAQAIPASLFQNNNLKNLVISNTDAVVNGGVTVGGRLDIYRSLTFGAGGRRIATGGYITLKSTATETAWLGQMTGTNIISGDVTVERYIPIHSKAWQFLSTPITASSTQTVKQAWQDSATLANQNRYPGFGTQLTSNRAGAATQPTPGFDALTPAGPSIKVYNRSTGGYTGINRTDTAISNPKGYMVFVRGDRSSTALASPVTATVMRTKGTLHTPANPPVTISLATAGFESIGNPYASAINFRQLSFTGGVQQDFFYLWDPKLTTTGTNSAWGLGGFQTFSWNGASFDVTPGGGSFSGSNRNIESGQAFFVNAPFDPGTVLFTEACKVTGSSDVNRVPTQQARHLRTNLNVITNSGSILLDGTLIRFNRRWSDAVDINDAAKMNNAGENLGLYRHGKILSVESRPPLTRTDTIFYNTGMLKVQQYELEIIPDQINDPGLQGFLEDKFLQTSTPVSLAHTTKYAFNIVNDPGSYASDRFYIVFRKLKPVNEIIPPLSRQASATEPADAMGQTKPGITVFPNPVNDRLIKVNFVQQEPGTYVIQISNKIGQEVFNRSIVLGSKSQLIPLQVAADLPEGLYTLTITGSNGFVATRQVLIQSR